MKHKNLTVNKLAFGNLKARRKQYTLMIIGIILAMIFTSASMFFAVCNEDSAEQLKQRSVGKQDYILRKCNDFDIEPFVKDGSVRNYATFEVIAYGYSPDDDFDDGMGIAVHNDKSRELSCFHFLEGRYPETENEIAIESDALYRMNITDAKVGDEITLNLRTTNIGEILEKEIRKTYILSGILKDRRYTYEEWAGLGLGNECPEYPAAVVYDGTKADVGGNPEIIALVDFNHEEIIWNGIRKSHRSNVEFSDAYKTYLYQSGIMPLSPDITVDADGKPLIMESIDTGYWIYTRSYASDNDNMTYYDMKSVTTLGTVLAVVLAIASCFGVINSFNTNLQERRKQIGMLRAVGATKRQIIKVFGREALLISLICAPISVTVAYFGLKLFSYLMGDLFIFNPEWYLIIIIGVIGILFVMAAALIPLFHAARVTPMQAIRNTELGRKMKNKKIKSVKDFNAQKLISKRSLTFHRFRQASVSLILIATIIVSCFCVSLLEYYLDDYNKYYESDYVVFRDDTLGLNTAFANFYKDYDAMVDNSDIDTITSNRYIGNAVGKMRLTANWLIDGEYPGYLRLAEFNRAENYDKYGYLLETHKETPEEIIEIYNTMEFSNEYKELMEVVGYEAEPFGTSIETEREEHLELLEEYVLDGEINIEKINSGEEIILVAPEEIAYEVAYHKDGYHSSVRKQLITNGLKKYNDIKDYVEILRESMPFKAGETVKLSILICTEKANEMYDKNAKAYDYKYNRYEREVKIGAIVSQAYTGTFYNRIPAFLTTNEGLSKFGCPLRYDYIDAFANTKITPEIEESLEAFFRAADYDTDSQYRLNESNKTELIATVAGIASIILLLFCIAASLVNNALTAKIREGKREIGTLRAVGASAKELTMIYIHQLLSTFGMGCGLGFGIYTAVFFSAKLVCFYGLHMEFPFEFRILTAVVICLVLFAVCSLNLYSKIKKQMKYSIVENIREL